MSVARARLRFLLHAFVAVCAVLCAAYIRLSLPQSVMLATLIPRMADVAVKLVVV